MTADLTLTPLGVWTPYEPDLSALSEEDPRRSALYLRDDNGRDWYETVAHNGPIRTLPAFGVSSENRISMVACQVERLYPKNVAVYLIANHRYNRDDDMVPLLGKAIMPAPDGSPRISDPPQLPPSRVSQAQAMVILHNIGILAQVRQIVADHPYEPVRLWFNHASHWERANPYLNALAIELNLSETQLDDLFRSAALLS